MREAHVTEEDLTIDMNNVYFACTECKTYVDAGYRWAYWQLEKPKTVIQGAVVEVDRLLSVDFIEGTYAQNSDNSR